MDWRVDDLRLFVAVVREGSLSAAARHLQIPRPSVSRRLATLERDAGVQLIWRTTRKLRPTEIGLAFFERCRRVLDDIDDAERMLADATAAPSGTLRISAPPLVGPLLLAEPVARYVAQYPDVTVDVQFVDRPVNVQAEGFDLAMRMGDVIDDTLVARPFGEVRRVLVAAPKLLRELGRPRGPDDLAGKPFLRFAPCPDSTVILHNGKRSTNVEVDVRINCNDYGVLLAAAIAGRGFAVLSTRVAGPALEAGSLERVLPRWSGGKSEVHLVYRGGPFMVPKLAAFLAMLDA